MPQEQKAAKTLMPYEELRRSFSEARQNMSRMQGLITDQMIQRLQESRKYAHSPISAAQRA
ncbi:MAG: hypothetical protein K9N47_07860 [Prosthecobacter sp.]|uniref:hypothetical protein n=1 Tax=Prosthecobacter sp. TaxID=1965333 RepID=UPI0025E33F0A|nr:hypothetical protein [Prosthecobacter sp.]MCF7786021.1 hypothetical protein [Prosthecobacter sp.]